MTRKKRDVTSKNSRERRNRDPEMMRAALTLFATKGYTAASVQDIADAIGVLKGSVYHYIESKEDLLFRIFLEAHQENESLMQEVSELDVGPVERLRIYLERSVLTALDNIERASLYFRDWRYLTGDRRKELVRHRALYARFLQKLIEAAYEAEGINDYIDSKHVASFVIGGVNWVADWLHPKGPAQAKTIAADYAALAMASILGSPHTTYRCSDRFNANADDL